MLCKLGWDIETAVQAGLTGKIDDTRWVKHARKNKRISITFDYLQKEQGIRICHELRKYGGKIIRIQGGPEQNPYHALGKLLFHYPMWYKFLETDNNDGVCVISDIRLQSCKSYTPEQYHQDNYPLDAEQFNKYIEKQKQKAILPIKHRKPRKLKHKEQQNLIL
jgi:hypothetical protein